MVYLHSLYMAVVFLWRFIIRPREVLFYLARRIHLLRGA